MEIYVRLLSMRPNRTDSGREREREGETMAHRKGKIFACLSADKIKIVM